MSGNDSDPILWLRYDRHILTGTRRQDRAQALIEIPGDKSLRGKGSEKGCHQDGNTDRGLYGTQWARTPPGTRRSRIHVSCA
jgi:hypothetical protein